MVKTNSFIKGILNNEYIKVHAEDQVPRKAGDAELRVYVVSESGFFIERIRGNKVIDFNPALYDKYSVNYYLLSSNLNSDKLITISPYYSKMKMFWKYL